MNLKLPARTAMLASLLLAASMLVSVLAATAKHAQGRLSGPVTLTAHDDAHAELRAEVTGTFKHLGRVSSTFTTQVELDPDGNPVPIPPSTGTIETPGGGTLSFTFKWKSVEVAPNIFEVTGPFTTTGGSGLLSGVTWNGEYQAILDLNKGAVVIDGAGMLERNL
jgi:hypothetical protein